MDAYDKILAQWAKEKPELNTDAMALFGRLFQVTRQLETAMAECHKQFGLKVGEFDVLATLLRSGEPWQLTPGDLINSLFLTSGAMTNRLDKLESKRLIERRHSTQDRRSVMVCLTPEGRTLINEAMEAHVACQLALTKPLSGQLNQLDGVMKTWYQALVEPR